jgi:phosphoribosylanthranilate isomerase
LVNGLNEFLPKEIIAGIGLRNQGEYVRDGSKCQHLIPELSVSNFKNGSFFILQRIIVQIYEVQTPVEAEALIELGVDHIGSVVVSEQDWKLPQLKATINSVASTAAKSSLILMNSSGTDVDHQPVQGFVGITGEICNWETARKLVETARIPVILAGGISPHNVTDGIRQVRPAGVDSCTRTNELDRSGRPIRFKKDLAKVQMLVERVRAAEKTTAGSGDAAA